MWREKNVEKKKEKKKKKNNWIDNQWNKYSVYDLKEKNEGV